MIKEVLEDWMAPLERYVISPAAIFNCQDAKTFSKFRKDILSLKDEILSAKTVAALSSSLQKIPETILAADLEILEKIKLLLPLCEISQGVNGDAPQEMPITQTGKEECLAGMILCLAPMLTIGALCDVITSWTPDNAQKALDMLQKVRVVFENLIYAAPDSWSGLSENLFQLRALTVNYLLEEVAALPNLVEIEAPRSLPSLVLAQILYGDGTRAAEIEAQNPTISPIFMSSKLLVKSS